jgi:hypothetical protein
MRGDALLSPAVTRRLIGEFVARPPDAVAAAGMETLTFQAQLFRGSSFGSRYSSPIGPIAVTCVTYSPDFAQ